MTPPTSTDPAYVPLRHSRWPSQRMPRWLLVVGVLVLAGAVLVGWAHRPTTGQRAADMNAFLTSMTTGIQSCAGGVRESLFAMRQIESGAETDLAIAIKIARDGANNCSPANNIQLGDLAQYQVHESLASFHLENAVDGLLTWAFPDAMNVQNDVAAVLQSHGSARATANLKLRQDLITLNAQRAAVYAMMRHAATATSATAKLPTLPG